MSAILPDWQQFSLTEAIAQMVVVRASGFLSDRQIRYPAWEAPNTTLQQCLETLNLGGVILLGGSAAELSLRTQQLQNWSKTPLLIAADIEEGVGQQFAGATWFPPLMALGEIAKQNLAVAIDYATQMGEVTAKEALAIGINWLLAPVADINNNPENPVINVRSFGDTAEIVSKLASAFIQGAQAYRVLTTAKHFPGHGDTTADSHLDLPEIPHAVSTLETRELVPFRAAIAAGVDSMMTAHLSIPAWDETYPATLSKAILTGILRHKLGFEGIIVTDALIMAGVANYASPQEVAVLAVEAGADILLMPPDPVVAIEAVYEAVKSKRISEARIYESVARIWQAKHKIFCQSSAYNLSDLSNFASVETAQNILRHSIRKGGKLPLKVSKRNLIVVDDLLNCDFLDRQSPSVAIPQKLGYDLQLIDLNSLDFAQNDNRKTLLQVFIRGNPFRGSAGLSEKAQQFYQELIKTGLVEGLMIYGSPYVLDWFKSQISPDLPWVFSYGQMGDAQAIAFERSAAVPTLNIHKS